MQSGMTTYTITLTDADLIVIRDVLDSAETRRRYMAKDYRYDEPALSKVMLNGADRIREILERLPVVVDEHEQGVPA